jgi:CBS domain-containing protein
MTELKRDIDRCVFTRIGSQRTAKYENQIVFMRVWRHQKMARNDVVLSTGTLFESQAQDGDCSAPAAISGHWMTAGDVMNEVMATISPRNTVASAAKIMSSGKISCLVVVDHGRLSGIVTETDVLKRAVAAGHNFQKMKVEQIMSSPVRSVPHGLSVVEASRIMEVENIRRLVVLKAGEPVGIITQTDMVRVLASQTYSKEVSETMTTDAVVITVTASAKEAAELMASRDISCLIVRDSDTVVGIFTERDLLKRVVASNQDPARIEMKQVMSEPVVSIPASYSLLSATKLMERVGIRRLVVMEHETLLGVITQTDILRALKGSLQDEEEKYFRFLSESENCNFTVGLDLNTTYVNSAFLRLLDVTDPNELMGQRFLPERFWQVPEQRHRLLHQLKKAGMMVEKLALKTARGRKLSVVLFSTPTKNFTGEMTGSQGILYNIAVRQPCGSG